MNIECYSEKDFQTRYTSRWVDTWNIAKKYGVDLSKYYFGQYLSEDGCEEVTYNHLLDENVCFDIQWYNGNLESVAVSMD
jgi:hypothetical protein